MFDKNGNFDLKHINYKINHSEYWKNEITKAIQEVKDKNKDKSKKVI